MNYQDFYTAGVSSSLHSSNLLSRTWIQFRYGISLFCVGEINGDGSWKKNPIGTRVERDVDPSCTSATRT